MSRDKSRMSRDITKEGPEKWTVSAGEMRSASINLVDAAVKRGTTRGELTEVLVMVGQGDWEFVRLLTSECATCGEGPPKHECLKSERLCGHHCNCTWDNDVCCWCGSEMKSD